MATTTTSSLPLATHAALYDELTKISAAKKKPKGTAFGRWAKNTLLIAGGTAAGTGVAMATDRVASKLFKRRWSKLKPQTRLAIGAPIGTAASLASMYSARKLLEMRRRKDKG